MTNFILIFLCIAAGMVMSYLKILPSDAYKSVNAWCIYVALPALALRFVPSIEWNWGILISVIGPLLVWGGAWLFVRLYDRKRKLSKGSRAALLIACGLGNTAFIGFPMISAFYGESEIHHAVVFDQVTFILFATLGVITVLKTGSEEAVTPGYIVRKVFRFPPFLACLTALILPCFITISAINPLLDKFVATLSPLALFGIGLRLQFGDIKNEWRLLTAGLVYKLAIAPCIILALAFALGTSGNLARISVFEAGMSSHITASMLATQYNLNPQLSSLSVGVGIIIGIITSSFWYFLLQVVF